MNYDEYSKAITELVTAGDGKEAKAKDILDALKADFAKQADTEAVIKEQGERIDKLNAANAKLFLSVTGQAGTTDPDTGLDPVSEAKREFTELFNNRFYPKKEK